MAKRIGDQKEKGFEGRGTIEFIGDGGVVLIFLHGVIRSILNSLLNRIDDEPVIRLTPTLKTHQLLIENILLIDGTIKFVLCLSPEDIRIMIRIQRRGIRLRNRNPLAQRLRHITLRSAPTTKLGSYKFIHLLFHLFAPLHALLFQVPQMLLQIRPQTSQIGDRPGFQQCRFLGVVVCELDVFVADGLVDEGDSVGGIFRGFEGDFGGLGELGVFLGLLFVEGLELFKVLEEVADDASPCYRVSGNAGGEGGRRVLLKRV